jgi:hypothetical protein
MFYVTTHIPDNHHFVRFLLIHDTKRHKFPIHCIPEYITNWNQPSIISCVAQKNANNEPEFIEKWLSMIVFKIIIMLIRFVFDFLTLCT